MSINNGGTHARLPSSLLPTDDEGEHGSNRSGSVTSTNSEQDRCGQASRTGTPTSRWSVLSEDTVTSSSHIRTHTHAHTRAHTLDVHIHVLEILFACAVDTTAVSSRMRHR